MTITFAGNRYDLIRNEAGGGAIGGGEVGTETRKKARGESVDKAKGVEIRRDISDIRQRKISEESAGKY